MDSKAQIHERTLSFLEEYLKKTPSDVIRRDIKEIDETGFSGPSAQEYFSNFNKYYLGEHTIQEKSQATGKARKVQRKKLSSLT